MKQQQNKKRFLRNGHVTDTNLWQNKYLFQRKFLKYFFFNLFISLSNY